MRILLAFFFFSVLSSLSFAQTRIAFLQSFDKNGKPVEYEPGGRFTHTAIQFEELGDMWLNAYPNDDVAIISLSRLQTHGTITEIIEIPQTVRMTEAMPYMGLPFDYWYSWSNDAIYCSELIGKILNIPTRPMHFNKNFWPKNYWKLEGTPGLSPDALYEWAVQQRLSPVP